MGVFKEKIKIIWNVIKAKQYFFASLPFKDNEEDVSLSNICCIVSDDSMPIFMSTISKFTNKIQKDIEDKYSLEGSIIKTRDEAIQLLKDGVQIFVSLSSNSEDGYCNVDHDKEYSYKYRKGILYETDNMNKEKEISWSYFGSAWHDFVENKKYVFYKKYYVKKQ